MPLSALMGSFFDRHLTIKANNKNERRFDLSKDIFKLKESD